MTGPTHYTIAEGLLVKAADHMAGGEKADELIIAAQVHATLALAAATAYTALRDPFDTNAGEATPADSNGKVTA